MSRKRGGEGGVVRAGDPADVADKEELRRRMEETRGAITETVAEIKSVVERQYEEVRGRVETVREGFGEVLDWREQFERNPVVWGAGAVSVGILIGLGLARAMEGEDGDEDSVAGRAAGELTALADAVLPTVSAQVKKLFGLDLDAYIRETSASRTLHTRAGAEKPAKKRAGEPRRAKASTAGKHAGGKAGAAKGRAAKAGGAKKRAARVRGK